jgi:FtsZ-binding cell division protein ZapB
MVLSIMTSDFESLAEKINQLVELTMILRRENAELRIRNAELLGEQSMMNERLRQARERVAGLINTLPTVVLQEEEASK